MHISLEFEQLMAISVRLGKALEARLRRHVAATGRSLASFVREAVDEKVASMLLVVKKRPNPYALGKHLFGRDGSSEQTSPQTTRNTLERRCVPSIADPKKMKASGSADCQRLQS